MEKLQHCRVIAVEDCIQEGQDPHIDLYTVLEAIDKRLLKLNSIAILESFVKAPEVLRSKLNNSIYEECVELINCYHFKRSSDEAYQESSNPTELVSLLSKLSISQDFELPAELTSSLRAEELSLVASVHKACKVLGSQLKTVGPNGFECALKLTELREIIEHIKAVLIHTKQCWKLWKYVESTPLFDYKVLSALYRSECFELSMLKLKLDMVLTKHECIPKIAIYEQEQQEFLRMENDYLEMLRKEMKLILMKKMNFLKWRYEVRIVPKYWQRFRRGLKKRFTKEK